MMQLRVNNHMELGLSSESTARKISLAQRYTGVPIFICPTTRVAEPLLLHITSGETLHTIFGFGDGGQSNSDFRNALAIRLFFEAGGSHCSLFLLPCKSNPEQALANNLRGVDGGFNRRQGIFQVLDNKEYGDTLAIPLLAFCKDRDDYTETVEILANLCSRSKNLMAVLDVPSHLTIREAAAWTENINSDRVALYYARIKNRRRSELVSVATLAAATIQMNDRSRSIEHTPANLPLELPQYSLEELSEEGVTQLNHAAINTVICFEPDILRVWGGLTTAVGSQYTAHISCSRFVMALVQALEELLEPYVWIPATSESLAQVDASINNFFDRYYDPNTRQIPFEQNERPKFQVNLDEVSRNETALTLDLSIFLNLPMTWVEVQMNMNQEASHGDASA